MPLLPPTYPEWPSRWTWHFRAPSEHEMLTSYLPHANNGGEHSDRPPSPVGLGDEVYERGVHLRGPFTELVRQVEEVSDGLLQRRGQDRNR